MDNTRRVTSLYNTYVVYRMKLIHTDCQGYTITRSNAVDVKPKALIANRTYRLSLLN